MSSVKELPSSNVGKYIQLVGLMLACGTLVFSYMKKEGIWLYADTQPPSDFVRGDSGVEQAHAGVFVGSDEKTGDPAGPTEQIQGAIVTVTTFWGQGTGFFLRENALITGRHLVEPDLNKIAALEEWVARNKEILQLEEAKLVNYQARLSKMSRRKDKEALNLLIVEREEYLADFRVQYERGEQRLAQQKKAQEQPMLGIRLANGVEQQASLVQISRNYDLALLRLSTVQKNQVLEPPPLDDLLRLGDPVFIPRSFTDARWSIGTFVGYRRIGKDNRMYLQIAAEFFQDKRGSPVVDRSGAVRAVVTKVGQEDQKFVFALPIDKVLDEFAAAFE